MEKKNSKGCRKSCSKEHFLQSQQKCLNSLITKNISKLMKLTRNISDTIKRIFHLKKL